VNEALQRLAPYSPAFSIQGKLPGSLNPDRTATWGGSNIGQKHDDWTGTKSDGTYAGSSFGIRHSHLGNVCCCCCLWLWLWFFFFLFFFSFFLLGF
jgi:hypothetical protein